MPDLPVPTVVTFLRSRASSWESVPVGTLRDKRGRVVAVEASRKIGLEQAVDRLLLSLKDMEATSGGAFPPKLDDIISADLLLTRWRAEAPPRDVEAVRRCYGEAHVTLLYAQCDATVAGQSLSESGNRRTFLTSFVNRIGKVRSAP